MLIYIYKKLNLFYIYRDKKSNIIVYKTNKIQEMDKINRLSKQ